MIIRPLSYHMLSLLWKKKKSFETLGCRLSYKRECKFGTITHPRWADSTLNSHRITDFFFWQCSYSLYSVIEDLAIALETWWENVLLWRQKSKGSFSMFFLRMCMLTQRAKRYFVPLISQITYLLNRWNKIIAVPFQYLNFFNDNAFKMHRTWMQELVW